MTPRRLIPGGAILLGIAAAALLRTPLSGFWHGDGGEGFLLLSGNIEAHESLLGFRNVQSRITELPVNEGQWVRKGTLLAAVDDGDYLQQVALAEAGLAAQLRQLESARQNLLAAGSTLQADQAEVDQRLLDRKRTLELQQKGFVSGERLDQAETALTKAHAQLERDRALRSVAERNQAAALANVRHGEASMKLARLMAGYTRLTAPFDGVVTVRQAELGEVVMPGTPVLTLADLDHVWLRAYLNEDHLGRVRLGQKVSITSDSHPDKRYQGQIAFISPKAEFTPKNVETHAERVTLVYRMRIEIANPEHELVPGMPADARIELQPARP